MSRLIASTKSPVDLRLSNINSRMAVMPKNTHLFLADYRPHEEETEAQREARHIQSLESLERTSRLRAEEALRLQTAGFNINWFTKYFKSHPKIAYPVAALTVAGIAYSVIKNQK